MVLPCRFLQAASDIFAFAIHAGINLVGDASVALVFGEADVMRPGTDPYGLPVPRNRRLPQPEVMAAGDHRDRFCLLIAEVLRAAKHIERAHGHGQVVFVFVGVD